MRDAAQKAIATNPEVTARFNAFRAADDDVAIASGGLYPRVDLNADSASNQDRITARTPADHSFSQSGVSLSITQLLWDGLTTRHEVERLDHARLTRYFEFVDASEQTALEAVRAYEDLRRYRHLVELAEDSYVQHKYAHDQIASRVRAGVGRGVDLEQAAARLALADSNRVTELANLHDVLERYRRIVGEDAPDTLPPPAGLEQGLPADSSAAIMQASMHSASVVAAVENLRAAQLQARSREGAFQPRVEVRARSGMGHNFEGIEDQKRDSQAGVFLSWNLFSGGADQARVRQASHLITQAADQRDKACRDARQVAAIAFNDVGKLTEQLVYLDRNVLAIQKARDAYRQQFDIGQRSLLDLLNAENEVYTAQRAYVNAEHDLVIARARTHAGTGSLVAVLGLTRAGTVAQPGDTPLPDVQAWQAGDDAAARCPIAPVRLSGASKSELDERARRMIVPVDMPTSPAAAPEPPAAAPRSESWMPPPDAVGAIVGDRLQAWARAWQDKDVPRYLAFYAPQFNPTQGSREQWLQQRRRALSRQSAMRVRVDSVQTRTLSSTRVQTLFDQHYESGGYSDRMRKTLTWERQDGQWLIVAESAR